MSNASGYPNLSVAKDSTLARRAAEGDILAFDALVRRHAPLMRAYARRLLPSNDEVDDVVQEAFITAWQRLPDLEDGALVKSWMMRIVSHKSIDRIRAARPHSSLEEVTLSAPEHSSPERRAQARSGLDALATALAELPEQQRQCWALKELADYSYDEIANELGLPVSTVRGVLARARKNLIPRMEEWRERE